MVPVKKRRITDADFAFSEESIDGNDYLDESSSSFTSEDVEVILRCIKVARSCGQLHCHSSDFRTAHQTTSEELSSFISSDAVLHAVKEVSIPPPLNVESGWQVVTKKRKVSDGLAIPTDHSSMSGINNRRYAKEDVVDKNNPGKTPKDNLNDSRWMKMYHRLVAYKNEHKGTQVPQNYDRDPQLGNWVNAQRYNYKKEAMPKGRVQLLNDLGFNWRVYQGWDGMYERLIEYKNENGGSTSVPRVYRRCPQLGSWVNCQRQMYKRGKLPRDRTLLLISIGFDFGRTRRDNEVFWNVMFQRLVEFKCGSSVRKDKQLRAWVNNQRAAYRQNRITNERVRLLNSIGFEWGATNHVAH